MSYILDALRKSDRERQLGTVPGVGVDSYVTSGQGPSWTMWVIGGLLVINSLGVGALYFQRNYVSSDANIPSSLPIIAKTITSAPDGVATNDAGSADQGSSLAVISDASRFGRPTTASDAAREKAETVAAESAKPAAKPDTTKVDSAAMAAVSKDAKDDLVPVSVKPMVAADNNALDQAADNIPPLNSMSPDFQSSVPSLNLDVHVFDKDPARRFVLINGQRLHDGEMLGEGLRVEKVVAKGVILSKNGIMFTLLAGQ